MTYLLVYPKIIWPMTRLLVGLIIFLFASLILLTSIFRSASVRYAFKLVPTPIPQMDTLKINYELPYPGRILPDHFLWPVKVVRDKTWLFLTSNPLKRAEISLLFADKRLSSSLELINKKKYNNAVSVIAKSEIYLDLSLKYALDAKSQGMDSSLFFNQLALAALKHRQTLETIRTQLPEDAQPHISNLSDYSKKVYEKASQALRDMGKIPPSNPFLN